jgi:hypothetical protein
LLVFALVIVLFIVIPASAEYQIQYTEDDKILFSNGSYWIKWDRIGNHTVGDQFIVNATTNFPAGTIIHFMGSAIDFDHVIGGFYAEAYIQPAGNQGLNRTSILVNTTGMPAAFYSYVFTITAFRPYEDLESYIRHGVLAENVSLYSSSGNIPVITHAEKTRTLQKQSSPSLIVMMAGILVTLLLFRNP